MKFSRRFCEQRPAAMPVVDLMKGRMVASDWPSCLFGAIFFSLFLSLTPITSYAYSNFIGYGYSSCATCHYNSFGNGPINDYGRALWASEIAGRVFHTKAADEETLANQSGFLGSTPLPKFWRPSIGYRGLYLTRNVGPQEQSRYITMQADITNVLRFGERENFLIVGNFGYAPRPPTANPSDPAFKSEWISREHYLRVSLSKEIRLFVGLMDKVFGLRIPDHNAFSRSRTGLAMNDQTHGAALHFGFDRVEIGIHGFAGNLSQDQDLRQKGASTTFEFEPAEKFRIGASALHSQNEYVQMTMAALHSRFGAGHGSSVITEVGWINKKPVSSSSAAPALYGFMQGLINAGRGFHFLNTIEYYTENIQLLTTKSLRWGPGFQYFPAQRIELRIEAINYRYYNPRDAQKDSWDLMSQLHLSF